MYGRAVGVDQVAFADAVAGAVSVLRRITVGSLGNECFFSVLVPDVFHDIFDVLKGSVPVRIVGEGKDVIVYLKGGELVQDRVDLVMILGVGVVEGDLDLPAVALGDLADGLAPGAHEFCHVGDLRLARHAVVGLVPDLHHADVHAAVQQLCQAVFCVLVQGI